VQTSYRRQPALATFLYRTWTLRVLCVCRSDYRTYRREAIDDSSPRDVEVLLGAAVALPRDIFEAVGGWDEAFTFGGEDLELCRRVRRFGRIVYVPEIEVTHLGSVSTKQHMGFASPNIAAGFVKFFRKAGASPTGLFFYKLVVTLDAPPRLLARSVQFVWRTLRARPRKAEKCRREVKGLVAFLLRGLPTFWRA
jgi:GT2 family glycosyltransferase